MAGQAFSFPSQGCGMAAAAASIRSPINNIWGPETEGSCFVFILRLSKISQSAPPWSELLHAHF